MTIILFMLSVKNIFNECAVEMTTNKSPQNISIKLVDNFLRTLLTGNVIEFSINLKQ